MAKSITRTRRSCSSSLQTVAVTNRRYSGELGGRAPNRYQTKASSAVLALEPNPKVHISFSLLKRDGRLPVTLDFLIAAELKLVQLGHNRISRVFDQMSARDLTTLQASGNGAKLKTFVLTGAIQDKDIGLLIDPQPPFEKSSSCLLHVLRKGDGEVIDEESP